MSEARDPVYRALWSGDIEEIDREIVRLAQLCKVSILEPGVIRRVLQNDASVCGTENRIAFRKLHDVLKLHLALREKLASSFGQAQTAAIEDAVIERLRKSFPDLAGPWPPA
jgi:hypothetical protein